MTERDTSRNRSQVAPNAHPREALSSEQFGSSALTDALPLPPSLSAAPRSAAVSLVDAWRLPDGFGTAPLRSRVVSPSVPTVGDWRFHKEENEPHRQDGKPLNDAPAPRRRHDEHHEQPGSNEVTEHRGPVEWIPHLRVPGVSYSRPPNSEQITEWNVTELTASTRSRVRSQGRP